MVAVTARNVKICKKKFTRFNNFSLEFTKKLIMRRSQNFALIYVFLKFFTKNVAKLQSFAKTATYCTIQ